MVFQRTVQQQQGRRRRPWLCGGGNSDSEVGAMKESTMSKTLNRQKLAAHANNNKSVVDTRTGSSSTGGDESSNSGNESRDQIVLNNNDDTMPIWKAENFLSAPLVEDDWWENDNEEDDDDDDESSSENSIHEKQNGSSAFSDDDDDDDDDDSRVANYIMRLQQQYAEATSSFIAASWDNSNTNNEIDVTITDSLSRNSLNNNNDSHNCSSSQLLVTNSRDGKRFCNRGLQTWYQARQQWVAATSPSLGASNEPSKANKKKNSSSFLAGSSIPESFRKELIQCLIDRRQFELSQSIPLSCIVDAYQEVWKEHGCD